eukprot:CAMPEP_0118917660 /NCGR_PEP_ID=MMETSP1166-20130328/17457_1 /TAXON_ID=1104430 /ORGANISM="Chrysoreinhardia sp, Strain CCMP3193" /LENGTH=128 /DNA_ID=CAMNT_0006857863 /DNA_START=320 /DNA_END=703 /DNA_ORIENTATION=+
MRAWIAGRRRDTSISTPVATASDDEEVAPVTASSLASEVFKGPAHGGASDRQAEFMQIDAAGSRLKETKMAASVRFGEESAASRKRPDVSHAEISVLNAITSGSRPRRCISSKSANAFSHWPPFSHAE